MSERHDMHENHADHTRGNRALTHSEADALLAAYTANELDSAEHAAVEQHVVECNVCQHALEEIRRIRRLLQSLAAPHAAQEMPASASPTYHTPSLADAVLAKLAAEEAPGQSDIPPEVPESEIAHIFGPGTFSRPVSQPSGVVDAAFPILPGTPHSERRQERSGAIYDLQQERYGRMKTNGRNTSKRRVWQRSISMLAAIIVLGILVGSFLLVLNLVHQGQNRTGGQPTTPAVSPTVPATQTSCPGVGQGRAAITPPLTLGHSQNIVYVTYDVQNGITTASTVWRYDVTTAEAVKVIHLNNELVNQALISADGQWILMLTQVGQAKTQTLSEIQLVRLDGKALQTLYCYQSGSGGQLGSLSWCPDGVTIAFNQGANMQSTIKLLNIATGKVKTEFVSTATRYEPRFWLDESHLYLVNIVFDYGSPGVPSLPNIYILDTSKGQNQHTSDLQVVARDLNVCYDFGKTPDSSKLVISQCYGLQEQGPSSIEVQSPTGGAAQSIYRSDKYPIIMMRVIANTTILFLINNHPSGAGSVDTSKNGLWKINIDGSGLTRLDTDADGQQSQLNTYSQSYWANVSRDGKFYAYNKATIGTGLSSAYYAPLSGGQPTKFADNAIVVGWTTM